MKPGPTSLTHSQWYDLSRRDNSEIWIWKIGESRKHHRSSWWPRARQHSPQTKSFFVVFLLFLLPYFAYPAIPTCLSGNTRKGDWGERDMGMCDHDGMEWVSEKWEGRDRDKKARGRRDDGEKDKESNKSSRPPDPTNWVLVPEMTTTHLSLSQSLTSITHLSHRLYHAVYIEFSSSHSLFLQCVLFLLHADIKSHVYREDHHDLITSSATIHI